MDADDAAAARRRALSGSGVRNRERGGMMKQTLLATTAIATVVLLAGEATAQTAPPLRLGVGGYFSAYGAAGFGSSDPGQPEAHKRNVDFKREAEVHFLGETKLDNGLKVGAHVELEAETCADQIDESYLWFEGNWGRLMLGSTNSAAYKLGVGAPAIDSYFDSMDPVYRLFRGVTGHPRFGNTAGGASAIDIYAVNMSGDSEKITWLSPRVASLRLGVSYTPANSEEASVGNIAAKLGSFSGMAPNNCTPNNGGVGGTFAGSPCTFPAWSDIVAVGLNHERQYGPVNIQAAIGYEIGFLQSPPVPSAVGQFNDRRAWQAGLDLGFAGFHVGGGWFTDDNGSRGLETQNSWALGASYTVGALTVGASYLNSRGNRAAAAALPGAVGGVVIGPGGVLVPTIAAGAPLQSEKLDRIVAGARYMLAPGIDLRGSWQYYGYRGTPTLAAGGANNNYFNALVLGTSVRF